MGRVFFNIRRNVHSLTADYQALATDSGKIFFLDAAAGLTLTLPAVADAQEGWTCRVYVSTNISSNTGVITEKTSADTNIIVTNGIVELEVDTGTDGLYNAGHTTISFADGVAVKGDWVDLLCDGTNWYAKGATNADGGATLA